MSVVAWLGLESLSSRPPVIWSDEMYDAAARMQEAIGVIAETHGSAGIDIDEDVDPNQTGLIGPEYTELFTTLGQLEAKRTTTNPDLAALMAYLLGRAGVGPGDTVAVGASASFPALMIATLTASEAIGAQPVAIISMGASSYGATRPDFDLLRIYQVLLAAGVVSTPPAAASLGGEDDVGADLDTDFRESLLERIRDSGVPLLHRAELRENVAMRMAIYLGEDGVGAVSDTALGPGVDRERPVAGRVKAFVNIGGNAANLGASPLVLDVAPGLSESLALPPAAQRGVLYEMSARGVPVIHLLHVRGLALRHRVPWDPNPLPEPGTTPLTSEEENRGPAFWLITVGYFAALLIIVGTRRGERVI